jgi:hypothetical protein
MQRFWYIRPQESIEELMMDPDFVTAIRTAKAKVVGNYWDSPEWNRVNKATGGAAAGPGHGVIALGADFFQPFKSRQWSTGGIWWRCVRADLVTRRFICFVFELLDMLHSIMLAKLSLVRSQPLASIAPR